MGNQFLFGWTQSLHHLRGCCVEPGTWECSATFARIALPSTELQGQYWWLAASTDGQLGEKKFSCSQLRLTTLAWSHGTGRRAADDTKHCRFLLFSPELNKIFKLNISSLAVSPRTTSRDFKSRDLFSSKNLQQLRSFIVDRVHQAPPVAISKVSLTSSPEKLQSIYMSVWLRQKLSLNYKRIRAEHIRKIKNLFYAICFATDTWLQEDSGLLLQC